MGVVVRTRIAIIGLTVSMAVAALACTASALTLGTTTFPAGATGGACIENYAFEQNSTDSAYDYKVPANGGRITSWSTNTAGGVKETPLTILLLRGSGSEFEVINFDRETLPNPLPTSGIATFQLHTPWIVTGGERLGLYGPSAGVDCYYNGVAIPAAETMNYDMTATPPAIGANYLMGPSPLPSFLVNVAAQLAQSIDVGISGSALPATITAGSAAEYAFTVSNSGASTAPVTFTDGVPSGLTILSAIAGSGSCSTAGQTVSCTIPSVGPGQNVPVSILVAAPSAGSFGDTATVSATSGTLTDANPGNNTATAALNVNAPPAAPSAPGPQCKVPRLAGVSRSVAKLVLPLVNCKVGKTTSSSSKKIHKGDVISTSPGQSATLAAGTAINIVISSGPPKPKKHKKK